MKEHKVVMLGDGGVGKSCLAIQFSMGHFVEEYDPTIEDGFRKSVDVDGSPYVLDIIELYNEEWRTLRESCIRSGECYALIYSITSRSSFTNISSHREQALRIKEQNTFPMVLIGNKSDLEAERQVSVEEGQELARSFGCPFFETSAKTNTNVTEAFKESVREINKHVLMQGMSSSSSEKKKDCLIM